MAKGNSRKRIKPKDGARRAKKKVSLLSSDAITYVDYKDVELLKRFMSDRAKIRGRRVTGNDSQQQREVARAIKNAREMGLMPYTSRVTTQRRGGRRDDGEGRGRRGDRDRDDGRGRRDESRVEADDEIEEVAEEIVEETTELVEETVEA